MPFAEVNGQRLHYLRDGGDGDPLLLIQGLSANHLHWGDEILELLRPAFDTIVFDNRGFGHSSRVEEPFTIADLARDAAGLLDALELDRVHVMGISMGGMVAQELTLTDPERVRTLTLGCTYTGGPGSALTDPEVIRQLGELFMSGRATDGLRAGFEFNVSPEFAADPRNYELVERVARELPGSIQAILLQLQAVGGHDTSARLKEIDVPTLVIHGTLDRILPVANAHAIAAAIPGARLELLEGVGHAFWWERPQRTAELVRELAARAPIAAGQ